MDSLTNRLADLLRQVEPQFCNGSTEEIAAYTMFYYAGRLGLSLGAEPLELERPTLENVEKAYKKGWVAVINDGKLLGFKKETPGYCE